MYEYRAEVTRVVDGDTVDCNVDLGFRMTARIRFRLSRINAPEVRGEERELGKASAAFLENLLSQHGNCVTIHTEKTGKYGRWLAEIFVGEQQNVNDELVKSGHATYYS